MAAVRFANSEMGDSHLYARIVMLEITNGNGAAYALKIRRRNNP